MPTRVGWKATGSDPVEQSSECLLRASPFGVVPGPRQLLIVEKEMDGEASDRSRVQRLEGERRETELSFRLQEFPPLLRSGLEVDELQPFALFVRKRADEVDPADDDPVLDREQEGLLSVLDPREGVTPALDGPENGVARGPVQALDLGRESTRWAPRGSERSCSELGIDDLVGEDTAVELGEGQVHRVAEVHARPDGELEVEVVEHKGTERTGRVPGQR